MALLSEIAAILGCEIPENSADVHVAAISSPESAQEDSIVFLSNPKFASSIEQSKAPYVITRKGTAVSGKICFEVDDPYAGYAKVAQLFEDSSPVFGKGIHPSAIIDPTVFIAQSAAIGPGTVIGAEVTIGEQCRIGARCVIEKGTVLGEHCRIDSGVVIRTGTTIGNRVIVQSGAVIGIDGFGNARENGAFIRIPAFGKVVIEDNADIGANTTIDRGNFEPTIIGRGVKLDNQIHIAHNVTVGEHTAIAAQTGISGSTSVGKRVIIGGQVGFVGHIHIGDDSFVGAKAGVSKSVDPKAKITGYPARDLMTMRRIEAAQLSLPQLLKELKRLRRQVETLEQCIR
jgi:UDP-3-O-[3-hydroxymyristoyl] glucosamine N-acyltransferase